MGLRSVAATKKDSGRVIDKAVAAGIKVATIGADAPESNRLFYCGTDNYAAGVECGKAMIRIVTAKGWTDRGTEPGDSNR